MCTGDPSPSMNSIFSGETEAKPITTEVDQKCDSVADGCICLLICTFCTWTQLCLEETICSKSVTRAIGERSSWIDFILLGWFGSFLLLTQWLAFISSGVCTLCAPYVSFLPGSPPSTKYQLSNRLTLCFVKIRMTFFFSPTVRSLSPSSREWRWMKWCDTPANWHLIPSKLTGKHDKWFTDKTGWQVHNR